MPPLQILVSVLDWGLGHATRCIPIIKSLQKQGSIITIACTPKLKRIFEKELTDVNYEILSGYNIRYSRYKEFLLLSLLWQTPRLLFLINKERKWLQRNCAKHKFDAIISDNRFGFFHKKIPSVYITHQLSIETGKTFLNKLAQKVHFYFINKFSECWVPDVKEEPGLAGKLSHPDRMPEIPVHYLGIYSRFTKKELPIVIDYLFILSGPEPQRGIFEKMILNQVANLPDVEIVLVRGLPLKSELRNQQKNLKIYNHLPAEDLSQLIQSSKKVICRSGYTSLLDLVSIQKAAHLIPTPGQTEQVYLAKYLNGKNGFSFSWQEKFTVTNIPKEKKECIPTDIKAVSNIDEVVKEFILRLRK